MDTRTIKALKSISFILNNITIFITIFVFSFYRLFDSVETVDRIGDLGYVNMAVSLLAMVLLMVPSIFSIFADVISMIIVWANNKLDTKALKNKIQIQIIIEAIQLGLMFIMAMLSGWIAFVIITLINISIQIINFYIWGNIRNWQII